MKFFEHLMKASKDHSGKIATATFFAPYAGIAAAIKNSQPSSELSSAEKEEREKTIIQSLQTW